MAVWIFNVYLKASTPPPHNGFTRWDGDYSGDKTRFPSGMVVQPISHTLVFAILI